MIRRIFLLILFGMVLNKGFSQTNSLKLISTTGNYCYFNNFSIVYSIGEVVINTTNNQGVLLTQGFNQEFKNSVTTDIDKSEIEQTSTEVFPNPVDKYVNVIFKDDLFKDKTIKIHSLDGQLIFEKNNVERNERINLSNYDFGYCILSVFDSKNVKIESFKLKINH